MLSQTELLENISFKFSKDKKANNAFEICNNKDFYYEKFQKLAQSKNEKYKNFGLAMLTMLLTGVRCGNTDSANGYKCINKFSKNFGKEVKTFGLTTLQVKHVKAKTNKIELVFDGKKQVKQNLAISDKFLIKELKTLIKNKKSNELLFDLNYNELHFLTKKKIGVKFIPKDFRTAYCNELFIKNILESDYKNIKTKKELNKNISNNIEKTANSVGHSKAVCKRSYITTNLYNFYYNNLLEILENNKRK